MAKKDLDVATEKEVTKIVAEAEEEIANNNEVSADDLEDADDDDDEVEILDKVSEKEEEDLSFNQICRNLLKDKNNKRYNGLVIKKISFDEKANFTQVNITLNKKVPSTSQYAVDGKHKTIYLNTFALASVVKEMPFAWIAQHIIDEPEIMEQFFTGATVDILQQVVPESEEYVNPFSTASEKTAVTWTEDRIIDYVVSIKPNFFGAQYIKDYAKDVRDRRREEKRMMMMMSM